MGELLVAEDRGRDLREVVACEEASDTKKSTQKLSEGQKTGLQNAQQGKVRARTGARRSEDSVCRSSGRCC